MHAPPDPPQPTRGSCSSAPLTQLWAASGLALLRSHAWAACGGSCSACGRRSTRTATGTSRRAQRPARRDRAAGLHTGGFVTGYRGSPLGNVDLTAWRAKQHLEPLDIKFQEGLNEDLAATSIWGTQQVGIFDPTPYDGVFSMWYGKGPGVDRSGDAFKHGNLAGTSPNGGVLLALGDDHTSKSSTTAHQSEPMLIGMGIPVLNPASIHDFLPLGLFGYAASR